VVTISRRTKKVSVRQRTANAKMVRAALGHVRNILSNSGERCGDASQPGSSVSSSGRRESDAVNHPPHYTAGKFEVIDVIEDWELGFHLGNVVKYVARSPHKGHQLEDLRKALWYLQRKITVMEKQ
jgi:hypothetical protein